VPADVAEGFTISFNDKGTNQTSELHVADGTKLYYTGTSDTAYATKAEAENAVGVVKTTVYFFNSGSWANVNAYVWGTSEVLGGWPGVEAKSNGDGWWSVDIPAAPSDGLNVIFNNNNGSQTESILMNDATNVYVTNDSTTKYASKLEAQAAIEYDPNSVTVYFYNNAGWSEVSAYSWGGASLGGWPGTAATEVEDDWWKITIPSPPSMNMNVIFNNNNNGSQTGTIIISDITNRFTCAVNTTAYPSKAALLAAHGFDSTITDVYFYNNSNWDSVYASVTKDGEMLEAYPGMVTTEQANNWWHVTIPSGVSEGLTVTFNDGGSENKSDTFTVNNRNSIYYTGADSTAYLSKIAAETALGVELSSIKVSFYNSSDWAAVGAYVYGPGALLGAWPGTQTIEEGSGWSSIIIPYSESASLHVIFNSNGTGNQSSDFVVADADNTYVTNFSSEMYSSKEAAETDNGVVNKTLVSIASPSAITALANKTAKTVEALGLPSTITINAEDQTVAAKVIWDLSTCTYDSASIAEQSFEVNGRIVLPLGVANPNSISLLTTINITVAAGSNIPTANPGTGTTVVISNPQPVQAKLEIEVALGDNGVLPAANIIDRITKSDSAEVNLSVQFGQNTSRAGFALTADILNAARQAEKTLSVTVRDEKDKELYTWSFDKEALNSSDHDMKDVDLALDMKAISGDKTLDKLDGKGLIMSFAYDGILPAEASVRVYTGNIEGVTVGSKIYLYHYNYETGKLETLPYSSEYIVDAEGYITVNIVHCSDYVALTQEASADIVTSIRSQIKVVPKKQTLYVGTVSQSSINIKIELPASLELVDSLKDKTSQSSIGAVTASYSSSNTKVASVLADGTIQAVGTGKATITTILTLYSGKVKTVKTAIKVKKPSITLTKYVSSIKVGSKFKFAAKTDGLNAADIIWTTSEKSILVIDRSTGLTTAKSKGTDYVFAKIGNTNVKRKVVVK
ncbi:MAG: starch-binding protein, partial [Mobilitalea sp.]